MDEARAGVERLLDRSRIESIVATRAPAFTRQVAIMAGDLTDAELERLVPAVTAAFAPDRLREDVADFMVAEAPEGTVDSVLSWLQGGASDELTSIADTYEPTSTLEEYARSLMSRPPTESRLGLVVEWAKVQGAGDFFVLLDQALGEAAHTVLAEFRPGFPPFERASGAELRERLLNSFDAAVVSFLYSLETVPDEILREATEEYATDAGKWYVETYSLGIAQAMRAAAGRVVAALSDPSG